jgi:hypothetical protein
MTQFSMQFDPEALKSIAAFAGFAALLSPEIQQAEQQLGQLIITKTHDNGLARFAQNSPGGLAESFSMSGVSPMEVEVGTDKPYGHRLDEGFDGADSLGRVYHNPPTWFFTDAVHEVEDSGEGMGLLQAGVERAFMRMGVSF